MTPEQEYDREAGPWMKQIASLRSELERSTIIRTEAEARETELLGNLKHEQGLRVEADKRIADLEGQLKKVDQDYQDYAATIRLNIPEEFRNQPQLDLCMQRLKEGVFDARQERDSLREELARSQSDAKRHLKSFQDMSHWMFLVWKALGFASKPSLLEIVSRAEDFPVKVAECDSLRAQLSDANRRIDTPQKHPDTERLDWLSGRFACISPSGTEGKPPSSWIVDEWCREDGARGDTLRRAIDEAIRAARGDAQPKEGESK